MKDDLPKPGAKDDADKATAAVADWKWLKKQLREVVKVQAAARTGDGHRPPLDAGANSSPCWSDIR